MENLVKLAKENKEAFADLYHQNVKPIYNFFLVRCGSREEAEDLTSITWEIVVKKICHLRSNDLIVFKAWLYKIAKNLLKKRWFKKSIKTVAYEEFLDNREEDETIEENFSKGELKKIWKSVDKLPKKQKEVVLLRFASDLKNKEIAKTMGLSEKTVASNLSRALDKLREDIGDLQ
jgi:RNA polymerase sigma-70 factor (ECF subfamily)